MPAPSKAMRKAAGMATAIQEGKMQPKPGTPSAKMAKSMKPSDLREFATTPEKGLPKHAPKKRRPPVKMVGEHVQKMPFPKR